MGLECINVGGGHPKPTHEWLWSGLETISWNVLQEIDASKCDPTLIRHLLRTLLNHLKPRWGALVWFHDTKSTPSHAQSSDWLIASRGRPRCGHLWKLLISWYDIQDCRNFGFTCWVLYDGTVCNIIPLRHLASVNRLSEQLHLGCCKFY